MNTIDSTKKKYTTKDINGLLEIILLICIFIGGAISIWGALEAISSQGVLIGVFRLILAIVIIAAYILMGNVNLLGFYLYLGMNLLLIVLAFILNAEVGIEQFFFSLGKIGMVFLILQIRKNGISAWKMMLVNQKTKGDNNKAKDSSIISPIDSDHTDMGASKSSCETSIEVPNDGEIKESSIEVPISPTPPPLNQISDSSSESEDTNSSHRSSEDITDSTHVQEVDRYTRLYNAISPANFVNPYSPQKVKLANELLEALINNKDNDMVISLIEEKAKNELGVILTEN